MTSTPITHILTDIVSSNEDYSGGCDYCLVSLDAAYVSYLLAWLDKVAQLHRADDTVHDIRCWDGRPQYLRFNDKIEQLQDVDGHHVEAPMDEPVLLAADPGFAEEDFQQVECQTVQVSPDSIWWSGYVKHTNVKIESAAIEKATLLKIRQSFGDGQPAGPAITAIQPAIRKIHDLLYLAMQDGQEIYSPDKHWDANVMAAIAEVIAQHIPRPQGRIRS